MTDTLSIEWMSERNANPDLIDFVIRNKLLGYPLHDLIKLDRRNMLVRWVTKVFTDEWLPGCLSEVRPYMYDHPSKYYAVYEYNDFGFLSYTKECDGVESWREYNEVGNLIGVRSTRAFTSDSIGTLSRVSDGEQEHWDYDARGNNIHYTNMNGVECWVKYDLNNKVQHYLGASGYEEWYVYDANGNQISYQNSDGREHNTPTILYANGQLKSVGDCVFNFIGKSK